MVRKGTRAEKIATKAIEILLSNPEGVRYSELVRIIDGEYPKIPVNTVHGVIWDLERRMPDLVYKPARGIFRHCDYKETEITEIVTKIKGKKVKEEDFYKPFAEWLENEMEDCTKAIPLGGNKLKDKWGTPDVIGIKEKRRSDIIDFLTEIVSAEIKIDSTGLITAFGQACAYKLFSHKSYIVIPKKSSEDDKSKLDSLCLIFGIGLVFFDNTNSKEPNFEIRARPRKQDPDMFYVNKNMKLLEKELF